MNGRWPKRLPHGLLALIALWLAFTPAQTASAHPLDQLTQHMLVSLRSDRVDVSVAIGGGLMANGLVLTQLDPDDDETINAAELDAWLTRWLGTLQVYLDGAPVAIGRADLTAEPPPVEDFFFGFTPIVLSFSVPLPADVAGEHLLAIRNDYLIDRTVFRMDVTTDLGAELREQTWPGASIRLAFFTDPAIASIGDGDAAEAAREWGKSGVLAEARELLEHERTPGFLLLLIGVFAFMGGLHAIQPGHGKTLVAAYLVATGGTPRDAFVLAGIVTFTHTISVFALGLATLGASELFLPSTVIPVMGVISGLLVAGMGVLMLRGALRRRRTSAAVHEHNHSHDHSDHHHHDHGHHGHDHARLSDEEHARLHLEEALAVRSRLSRRGLVTMGVSGGLAPCPDALAILLLAIGMGQAAMGMLAIVAFSAGLATILVAFGLGVALAGPFWTRLRARGGEGGRASRAFNRFATTAPIVSAAIVLVLGLVMTWRSVTLG
jgi:ABC-type nickel/cobalt efflux system permease component RcnA